MVGGIDVVAKSEAIGSLRNLELRPMEMLGFPGPWFLPEDPRNGQLYAMS